MPCAALPLANLSSAVFITLALSSRIWPEESVTPEVLEWGSDDEMNNEVLNPSWSFLHHDSQTIIYVSGSPPTFSIASKSRHDLLLHELLDRPKLCTKSGFATGAAVYTPCEKKCRRGESERKYTISSNIGIPDVSKMFSVVALPASHSYMYSSTEPQVKEPGILVSVTKTVRALGRLEEGEDARERHGVTVDVEILQHGRPKGVEERAATDHESSEAGKRRRVAVADPVVRRGDGEIESASTRDAAQAGRDIRGSPIFAEEHPPQYGAFSKKL
ncbi:hypothetical protein B0H14DRAFT_2595949 [Mycena olivaceomarginata]|nr:hypothetical protein B0H14DRAFT_2595949 [Mycena olivaceomarginata]